MSDTCQFSKKATSGQHLTVVFLGGSLTWGAQATNPQLTSYRALVSRRLEQHYPHAHFRFWDAAIGGTGSQLAAFRLERDVLAQNPDLVFLDFTINDEAYAEPDPGRLAAYESLVRRLTLAHIPVVQVILPAKKDVLPAPPQRPLDEAHKTIGRVYGLPCADAVALVKTRVVSGQVTPDQLWDLPQDATHPGDAGYALYAEAAWQAYLTSLEASSHGTVPQYMIHANTYMTVNRHVLAAAKTLPSGWQPGLPNRSAIAYDFTPSRWMDCVTVATPGAVPLSYTMRGHSLFLFGEGTPSSGKYHVRINDRAIKTVDIGTAWPNGNGRYFEKIIEGLDSSCEQQIEIVPELQPGQELRFESLCIAGAPATIS